MASPQPTDAHIRIAHSIEEEIMMRDFTKRQRAIMDLILRLSWGCCKKTAYIPLQKDFELVGIDQTKIKGEIDWLIYAKVIHRDRNGKEYAFNKNYDEWKVSIVPGYNRERFNELLSFNIYTCQNSNLLAKTASIEEMELDEKASSDLTKKQVILPANQDNASVSDPPKESIKESNIITTTNNPELAKTASIINNSGRLPGAPDSDKASDRLPGASEEPHAVEEIANYYFSVTGRLANSKDYIAITEVLDRPLAVPIGYKSRIEVIKQAMARMSENRSDKGLNRIKSFSYFKDGIMDDYRKLEITQTQGGNTDGKHNPNPASGNTRVYGNGVIDYNQGFTNK